ncbi:TcpE family conjugal transfer membrane protein [Patulibacter sp. NPDC049589]|uniref:TcpE family conjugal transfer membrane protein n=1 Tax=Patulibacter sp. NPDC049589 TaxID=3154731 RepID=UPI003423B7A6
MSGDQTQLVRSYQRIFTPDRRIYQIEGHRLPVPGGIPLAWLAYATATLLTVVLLSTRSIGLTAVLAAVAAAGGWALGDRRGALLVGVGMLLAAQVTGMALTTIDWPSRLVILPAAVATLATQATPDGRPMHRYVRSWLALRLRPARRSLGRPLPAAGQRRVLAGRLWVMPDHHLPVLRRGRISGPATVTFATSVEIVAFRLWPGRSRIARPVGPNTDRAAVATVEVARGERLEVRP